MCVCGGGGSGGRESGRQTRCVNGGGGVEWTADQG